MGREREILRHLLVEAQSSVIGQRKFAVGVNPQTKLREAVFDESDFLDFALDIRSTAVVAETLILVGMQRRFHFV